MDYTRNDSNERESGDPQMTRAELMLSGSKSIEEPITLDGLSQNNNLAGRSNRFAELLSKVEANIANNRRLQAATMAT